MATAAMAISRSRHKLKPVVSVSSTIQRSARMAVDAITEASVLALVLLKNLSNIVELQTLLHGFTDVESGFEDHFIHAA